jgi:hypothetical protein
LAAPDELPPHELSIPPPGPVAQKPRRSSRNARVLSISLATFERTSTIFFFEEEKTS